MIIIALGHFHTPQNVIRDVAAYSGALEPIESNDLGAHGYIEGRIENGKVKFMLSGVIGLVSTDEVQSY